MGMPVEPAFDQDSFRFRDNVPDPSGVDAAFDAGDTAANSNPTLMVDTFYRVRFLVQQTVAAAANTNNQATEFRLQYNNTTAGSGWVTVGTEGGGTDDVEADSATGFTDNATTGQVLGAGSNVSGSGNHDNTTGTVTFTDEALSETELEFGFRINSGAVSNNDTIQLRLIHSDNDEAPPATVLDSYTNTPSITVDATVTQNITAAGAISNANTVQGPQVQTDQTVSGAGGIASANVVPTQHVSAQLYATAISNANTVPTGAVVAQPGGPTQNIVQFHEKTLVAWQSTGWRYDETDTDYLNSTPDFREASFDPDSPPGAGAAFETGQGAIYRGALDSLATETALNTAVNNARLVYYAIYDFTEDAPAAVWDELSVEYALDDACFIYLNNVELTNNNWSAGPSHTVGADAAAYEGAKQGPDTAAGSAMASGANRVGVIFCSNSVASSDICFDMELVGRIAPDNTQQFGTTTIVVPLVISPSGVDNSNNGLIGTLFGANDVQGGAVKNFWKQGVSRGNLSTAAEWQEASGLARPTRPENAGYLWVIPDGAFNPAIFHALNVTDASDGGTVSLTGRTSVDSEDISSAKVGNEHYIYLGDHGDNASARATFQIVRVKEPIITGSDFSLDSSQYEVIECEYPGGNLPTHKDAECLIVDPDTGDMYVITKRETNAKVYSLAHQASYTGTQTLVYEGEITTIPQSYGPNAGNVVGGDIHPSGELIFLKNYKDVYIFTRNKATQTVYQALSGTPTIEDGYVGGAMVNQALSRVNHPNQEPQGEAVTFGFNGIDYYSVSEYLTAGGSADGNPLYYYERINGLDPDPVTIEFQDGVEPTGSYAGTLDTYIWNLNGDTSYGTEAVMTADINTPGSDERRALIKFDLSDIPSGAQIIQVYLDLYIAAEGQGVEFYKVLKTWNESSTWNNAGAGTGFPNDGTEAAVALDALAWQDKDTDQLVHARVNLPVATVQDWIDTPANNYGWVIHGFDAADGMGFATREATTASERPRLFVRYIEVSQSITGAGNISDGDTVPGPVVQQEGGPQFISPAGMASTEAVGSATVIADQQVSPGGIASTESVGTLVATGGDRQYTVCFQQGTDSYTGYDDATTFATTPDTVVSGDLTADIDPALKTIVMKWDVSSIPTDAIVDSATLELNVTDVTTSTWSFYELLVAFVGSECTFNDRSSGNAWSTGGGIGSGTDRAATALQSGVGPFTVVQSELINLSAGFVSKIQDWVDGMSTNNGILVYDTGGTSGWGFSGSDNGTASLRPELCITYTVDESPTGSITGASVGENSNAFGTAFVDDGLTNLFPTGIASANTVAQPVLTQAEVLAPSGIDNSAATIWGGNNVSGGRGLHEYKQGVSQGNFPTAANWQEISGMARPQRWENRDYIWCVPDGSFTPAIMHAINKNDASDAGTWSLTGRNSVDTEDMDSCAVGGEYYLYLADFGDNANARSSFQIVRVKEPVVTGSDESTTDFEVIDCVYSGTAPTHKDAEVFLVDPDTGDMYVVTKRESVPGLYKLDHAASYAGQQNFVYQGDIHDPGDFYSPSAVGNFVGGTINSDGTEIFLKTYGFVHRFTRNKSTQTILQALQGTPTIEPAYVGGAEDSVEDSKVSHPSQEPQGEAIAFDFNGKDYYSISEYVSGSGSGDGNPMFKYEHIDDNVVTIEFQDGVSPTGAYAGTEDTYIWSLNADTSYGTEATMIADINTVGSDERRALIKFDISAIPSGSTIIQVYLDLYIANEGQGWDAYKVLKDWDETSTWNNAGAGTGFPPNDVEASSTREVLSGQNKDADQLVHTRLNLLPATVQDWVDTPANNYGWVINGTHPTDGQQFATREATTSSERPRLFIRYIPANQTVSGTGAISDGDTVSTGAQLNMEVPMGAAGSIDNTVGQVVGDPTVQSDATLTPSGIANANTVPTGHTLTTSASITATGIGATNVVPNTHAVGMNISGAGDILDGDTVPDPTVTSAATITPSGITSANVVPTGHVVTPDQPISAAGAIANASTVPTGHQLNMEIPMGAAGSIDNTGGQVVGDPVVAGPIIGTGFANNNIVPNAATVDAGAAPQTVNMSGDGIANGNSVPNTHEVQPGTAFIDLASSSDGILNVNSVPGAAVTTTASITDAGGDANTSTVPTGHQLNLNITGAGAIADGDTVSSPTIQSVLSPGGIGAGNVVPTGAQLDLIIFPGGIDTANVVPNNADVDAGAAPQNVSAAGAIASANTVPTGHLLTLYVEPGGIPNANQLPGATVTTTAAITAGNIVNANALPGATVTTSASIEPNAIFNANDSITPSPTVSGESTITPGGIANANQLPGAQLDLTIYQSGAENGNLVGDHTLQAVVEPSGISNTNTVPTGANVGAQGVTAAGAISNGNTVPTGHQLNLAITPSGISDADTVATGAQLDLEITFAGAIASTSVVPATLTVQQQGGPQFVAPTGMASTGALGDHVVAGPITTIGAANSSTVPTGATLDLTIFGQGDANTSTVPTGHLLVGPIFAQGDANTSTVPTGHQLDLQIRGASDFVNVSAVSTATNVVGPVYPDSVDNVNVVPSQTVSLGGSPQNISGVGNIVNLSQIPAAARVAGPLIAQGDANTSVVPSHTVSLGAAPQNVTGASVGANGNVVPSHQVDMQIRPGAAVNGNTVSSPELLVDVTIAPAGIPSANVVPTPAIGGEGTLVVIGISSANVVPSGAVVAGPVTTIGVDEGNTVPSHTVSLGAAPQTVTTTGDANTSTVPTGHQLNMFIEAGSQANASTVPGGAIVEHQLSGVSAGANGNTVATGAQLDLYVTFAGGTANLSDVSTNLVVEQQGGPQFVSAPGLPSTEAFGDPVVAGPVTVQGIASSSVVPSHTVNQGAAPQNVTGASVGGSTENVPSPSVGVVVEPSGVPSGSQVGDLQVNQTVRPIDFADDDEVPLPVVTRGGAPQSLTTIGAANPNFVPAPDLGFLQIVDTQGAANSTLFGADTEIILSGAPRTITTVGIGPDNDFGDARLTLYIDFAGDIANASAVPSPSVQSVLQPVGIPPTSSVGSPVLDLHLFIPGIGEDNQVGDHLITVSVEGAGGISDPDSVGQPSVGFIIEPQGIEDGDGIVPGPSLGLTITPSGIGSANFVNFDATLNLVIFAQGDADGDTVPAPTMVQILEPQGFVDGDATGSPDVGFIIYPGGFSDSDVVAGGTTRVYPGITAPDRRRRVVNYFHRHVFH